jgi:hypothetical protein
MKDNRAMGLLGRIFGGKDKEGEAGGAAPASSQFHEAESTPGDSEPSRNAPRRELVQMILRDTMRKHGIPSDWIECRILAAVSRTGRPGLHVNFVVKSAHHQMLGYVFAFQDSFERELARYEPRARDWLMSLGWEFRDVRMEAMPAPKGWLSSVPAPLAGEPAKVPDLSISPAEDPFNEEPPKTEEDIERDLAALFAIRDAAMADAVRQPPPPDFQSTLPSRDFTGDDGRDSKGSGAPKDSRGQGAGGR